MAARELPGAIASTHAGRSCPHWIQYLAGMAVAQAPTASQAARGSSQPLLGVPMTIEQPEDVREPFAERHYTINELAFKWSLSGEFVRQLVQHEPGVTEWVRQRPGRRRYRVLRVPSSVAERIYLRAKQKAASGSTRQVVIHP